MLTLPLITFTLLIGRLSPGPSALPYRHHEEQASQATTEAPVAIVTSGVGPQHIADAAFCRPPDLRWNADWARDAARKAVDMIGFHAQNSPLRLIREVPWNIDLAPTILRGGGAALLVKIAY